jgi:hypothetical protein
MVDDTGRFIKDKIIKNEKKQGRSTSSGSVTGDNI